MAKLVYISKYPPLEGGIAAKTFWLSLALGRRGHHIHVVTDRKDVDKVHTLTTTTSIPNHANVAIYRPLQRVPWHIPHDEHRTPTLLDKALEVIEREKPDLIEAGYLVPYGLVAYLASKITGLPYVLQHGGSDIKKFVEGGLWPNLWREVLSSAECVITDANHRAEFERWNARSRLILPYVPDPAVFRPVIREKRERPVLSLIGKANYHWEHKGWHRVIDIWSKMGEDFEFMVVSQGIGLERFQAHARERLGNRVSWRPFLPPWEIPSLLQSMDALFCFEADLPFPMFSNLFVEALFCGTPVISDREDVISRYRNYGLNLSRWHQLVLWVGKDDPIQAAERIKNLVFAHANPTDLQVPGVYQRYISAHEGVF
ncbi:MAG: glycosyltransferase [Candidatus Hodarchaeota archaeon]